MVKRLKMMLKKEKGFTLVELLAVIVILGIILAIAVPSIGNVISNSENKAHDANIELIKNAARLADVSGDLAGTDSDTITVAVLNSSGYLEVIPKDPRDDTKEYTGTVTKKSDGSFTYTGETAESTPIP